jgi:hypothetical protein
MNKTKFLTFLIIGLIVTNGILIFTILRRPESHRPHPGKAKHIVIEKLHLDENQIEKYESLIHWHRNHIDESQHKIMTLKSQLYQTLQKPQDSSANAKIIDSIGKIQVAIEQTHYKHFQDIRNLCRPDQLKDYDAVITEITEIFGRERR